MQGLIICRVVGALQWQTGSLLCWDASVTALQKGLLWPQSASGTPKQPLIFQRLHTLQVNGFRSLQLWDLCAYYKSIISTHILYVCLCSNNNNPRQHFGSKQHPCPTYLSLRNEGASYLQKIVLKDSTHWLGGGIICLLH